MMNMMRFFLIMPLLLAPLVETVTYAEEGEPPKPVAKKYRRSKYTHDQSEGLADRRKVLLSKGEDKVVDLDFDVPSDKAILTGNPAIVLPQVINIAGQKRQLVFKPLGPGETTVTVRNDEGDIKVIFAVKVTGSNLLRQASEIRELLKDIEGLNIRIVGQKIILDGQVLVPNDYGRILMLTEGKSAPYNDVALNLVTISPLALQVLAKKIQEDINSFAPNVKTRVVNGVIFLEGTVEDPGHAKRSAEIANTYLPEAKPPSQMQERLASAQTLNRRMIQNFIVINEPPKKKQEKLVRVTVHFVELAKDYNKVFGFKWQPTFTGSPSFTVGQTGGDAGTQTNGQFVATISSLFPKLGGAQKSGFARVLKTGTILTRSGLPAKIDEQTSFPYSTIGANGTVQTQFAPVGLVMAVTPLILGQTEDIQMEVDLNQVSLTQRAPSGGAPVTSNHRVTTKIFVKNNESAAVAAMTSQDVGTDFNKDDPQGDGSYDEGTETLFSLLRSKGYRKKKTQFVVFITPQIIENASDGTEDLKKNFKVKVK
jgi:pilus assembly protein CpaC